MKRPALIIGIVVVAIVVGVLIYSSMGLARYKVEACMEFNGRQECRTAAGTTKEYALRSAIQNACGLIASGVGDTIACEHSTPVRVTWK